MSEKAGWTMKEAIADHMKWIDSRLQWQEEPLHSRPLIAAVIFVTECILEIQGDTKDDFATKRWFANIFHHIRDWYRDQYGPAIDQHSGEAVRSGVILVRQVPVELRVPLTRTLPGTPGETVWLEFPISIAKAENPETWLVNPPNLEKLDELERRKVSKQVRSVAINLRRFQMYTLGVKQPDPRMLKLLTGVMDDLERGATSLLTDKDAGRGGALWSVHMAAERVLKAFALQKTGTFREIHDLFSLFDDIKDHAPSVNRNLLKKLPNSRDAIDGRYGLGSDWTIGFAVGAYVATVQLLGDLAELMDRDIQIAGSRVHLSKPPWLELPPSMPNG